MIHVRTVKSHQLLLLHEAFEAYWTLTGINISAPIRRTPLRYYLRPKNHRILLIKLLAAPHECQIHEFFGVERLIGLPIHSPAIKCSASEDTHEAPAQAWQDVVAALVPDGGAGWGRLTEQLYDVGDEQDGNVHVDYEEEQEGEEYVKNPA